MPMVPADNKLHAFATFMGLPPDSDTPPVCGATLTASYDGRNKPHCPECDRIVAKRKPLKLAGAWIGDANGRNE